MLFVFLSILTTTSRAGVLDLTNTSSTGCGVEWYGSCLPNDVWGSTDVFGVATPTTVPVLSVGASSTSTSKIAVAEAPLGSNDVLFFDVRGRAFSAATTISMETRFFNAGGGVIATHTDMLHTGHSGMFSVTRLKSNLPTNTASWKTRLVVSGGPATFNHIEADGEDGEDGQISCEDCYVDCGDYTAVGQECNGYPCTAECNGVFGEGDCAWQGGVVANP